MRALSIFYAALTVLAAGTIPCVVLKRAPPPPSNEATTLDVPEGDRDAALDVHLVDETGQGVASATVRAFVVGPSGAVSDREAISDATGTAHLPNLLHTTYWITADASGRTRASSMVLLETGVRRLDLATAKEHILAVEVRDEDGLGVAGASIEVRTRGEAVPIGAKTDNTGNVNVGRLGPGPFAVHVKAAGLGEATEPRAEEGTPLRVVLKRLGVLFVKVLDEKGAPSKGARVLLSGPSLWPPRVTETNDAGEVKVSGLDGASYALRAVRGGSLSRLETSVAVNKGEERRVELKLVPGRSARVTVVEGDADDAPTVAGARVVLVEGGLSPFPIEAVTDKRGAATLGPFLESGATITASADELVGRSATLGEGQAELTLHLARAGTIEGRVVDARGFPIDGVALSLVGTDTSGGPIDEDPSRQAFRKAHFFASLQGPRPLVPAGELGVVPGPVPPIPRAGTLGEATGLPIAAAGGTGREASVWVTKRDGTFVLGPATPGRIRVIARHPSYVEAESAFLNLVPGGHAEVTLTLSRGGSLEGRVVDLRGVGVQGAHVTAAATDGSYERSARTAQDGTFAFASLPSEVTLLLSPVDDPTETVARAELTIANDERKQVVLTMPAAREAVAIRVVDRSGRGIEGAQVSARSDDARVGFARTAFTERDGSTSIPRSRGLGLRLEVSVPGFAPLTLSYLAAPAEVLTEMHEAERVEGRVTDERGNGIAEASLRLDCGERVHAGRPKDARGEFAFTELAPGPCTLHVSSSTFSPVDVSINVAEARGRKATEIPRVELQREAIVEGVVVDDHGKPVAGARVALGFVPVVLAEGAAPPRMARTDERGRFRLASLPEGALTIEAYGADVGRGRIEGVHTGRGSITRDVRITLARLAPEGPQLGAGSVAVTLGQTKPPDVEVVLIHVAEGSEAERAGLRAGDTVETVNGARARTIEDTRARLGGPLADDVVLGLKRGEVRFIRRVPRERIRK